MTRTIHPVTRLASWCAATWMAACAVVVVIAFAFVPAPAHAVVAVSATPSYPAIVVVGESFPAQLTIRNVSTYPDDATPVDVEGIFVTPSCASRLHPLCVSPFLDPGQFRVSNLVPRTGTACFANHFVTNPANTATGEVRLIADFDIVLGAANAGGSSTICIIDFNVTVLKLPDADMNSDKPGVQTAALAHVNVVAATGASLATPSGDGFAGFAETTVRLPPCPDASPLLGAARACTILQYGSAKPGKENVTISGPGAGIGGDICVGPGSKLTASGANFITGGIVLDLDPAGHVTATCSSKAPGVNCGQAQPRDLGAEINACTALAASAAGKGCTIGDYRKSLSAHAGPTRTLTGSPGENVVCVKEVNLGKDEVITLTGGPSTTFIINVRNKFDINGGKIRVDGVNVQPADVIYNVLGSGEEVSLGGAGGGDCCKAEIDGSLVAGDRNIALNPGRVNGMVCGDGSMSFDAGSSVCRALVR